MKNLIELEDWNNIILNNTHRNSGNGIACPNCGKELYDLSDIILLTSPGQIRIFCRNEECNYKGTRYC